MSDKSQSSYAFVKEGSFSHTNEYVLGELQKAFPECQVDVVDVLDLDAFREVAAPRLAIEVAREYGLRACFKVGSLQRLATRTAYSFRKIRVSLLRRLSHRPYVFTFQTQSIFDASTAGAPHFLYTDHTHLANLTYPDFPQSDLNSRQWIELERTIYRNAHVNFTMSSNISRSLIEQYDCAVDQVQCVYAGSHVDTDDTHELPPARFGSKNILFVGVDWERKGGPTLVEAFGLVRQAYPSATLTVVGCSPDVELPGCKIVGRVQLAEVAAYYQAAAIFCLPTRVEPFGIVFLEAFAHALPVVATNIGAIPDFVEEGVSGYLIPPGDVVALADRLIRLLRDPEKCADFGRHGCKLVRQRYTWSATGERIASRIRQSVNIQ